MVFLFISSRVGGCPKGVAEGGGRRGMLSLCAAAASVSSSHGSVGVLYSSFFLFSLHSRISTAAGMLSDNLKNQWHFSFIQSAARADFQATTEVESNGLVSSNVALILLGRRKGKRTVLMIIIIV